MYSFSVVAPNTARYGSFGGELIHAWPGRPYIVPYYFGIVTACGVGWFQTALPISIISLGDAPLVLDSFTSNRSKVLLTFPRTKGLEPVKRVTTFGTDA